MGGSTFTADADYNRWGGETGEPHGHRRTLRPVTAEAAATTATEATAAPASGRGLKPRRV